jgi:TldD protein
VKDAAYQGSTPSFWASLAGVGGPDTFVLHAASNCGKAQPAQGAWVSHGAPVTVFREVNVLNTKQEAGQ